MPSVPLSTAPVMVAVAAVVNKLSGQRPHVLISRRKPDQVLGGLWELPGGKIEPGEQPRDAVIRELQEEVGITVQPIATLDPVEHRYDHATVRLLPFICQHTAGTPQPIEVDQVRWVNCDELSDYTFPKASQPILTALQNWLKQEADNLA